MIILPIFAIFYSLFIEELLWIIIFDYFHLLKQKYPSFAISMQHRNQNTSKASIHLAHTISQINEAAYILSQKNQFDAAIAKLKQGEQLLEYAAESCRNIDRQLIIVILHNMVSLSQIKWDLQTASNYLEGLIYNFQLTNSSKNNSRIDLSQPAASASLLQEGLDKAQLAEYYLQYCAVNSQLRKHKNAQCAARKGLRIIASLLRQSEWIKHSKNADIPQYQIKRSILKYLLDHWESNSGDKDNGPYLIAMCEHLWKGEIVRNKKSTIQSQLRLFSIGNVMTLDYRHINGDKKDQKLSGQYFVFILMSMSLFSLATEVRFENEQKFNEAKYYHSLAIIFYYVYIPFESPYIQHIKQNFIKNYGKFYSEENSPPTVTYNELLSKIRRDSILQSSLNLQQESVNSIEQEKRRNQRLKEQSMKLKMLCLAQVKPKRHQKSYEKAKSLTISHSNAKKTSVDSQRHYDRASKNINKTNLYCQTKVEQPRPKQQQKKKRQEKEVLGTLNNDELAEKYFQMAFKKDKMKSPQPQRKTSIRSTSSTTKDRSGNESKNAMRRSKEKISTIKTRKANKK